MLIENRRREYNTVRPHSLDYRPPAPETVIGAHTFAVDVELALN
jgi:hypothetical protein